jgi:hypothetical protein
MAASIAAPQRVRLRASRNCRRYLFRPPQLLLPRDHCGDAGTGGPESAADSFFDVPLWSHSIIRLAVQQVRCGFLLNDPVCGNTLP